ncbi:SulP family inorganic anion transporter [Paludibaculum fermentans]|uniref:SulP family inorganic anion transporter n=1 Tax=Paludibaculum fermentans TaxID=1473598 RepID=A0A7S7SIP8_PALFE|nr:SulP family inorganic anion transporter [Paludibaculum fermentans]QOY87247.1 SulP family inorganic anion transporter [Paludibaculum fermentans]
MQLPKLRYTWKTMAGDLSGGFIAALIALPYGLAMAALMGLPPVLGVFTSLLTSPITAILGRNPVLIGGTSSVTVPFIAEAVRLHGLGGAAKVSLVASVFMMAFSLMRLGRYVSMVPHPVVTGFSCGIGGMMVVSQLFTITGIKGSGSGSMVETLVVIAQRLTEARFQPLLLSLLVIGVCVLIAKLWPRLPAPLIGVGVALLAAKVFAFREAQVGVLSLELPPFAGFAWAPKDVFSVLPTGFALAFVSSVNILITSRVVEHFRGRHIKMKKVDADVELGAYGISNVIAGMFGAPMSVGIPARSLASIRCGGTTRMSNIFHAAVLAAVIGFGSGILAQIPLAALAGVTAWMGFCLLDWSAWRRIPRMKAVDAASFLTTALLVLCVNAVAAVAVGCSFYGVEYLWKKWKLAGADAALGELQAEAGKQRG